MIFKNLSGYDSHINIQTFGNAEVKNDTVIRNLVKDPDYIRKIEYLTGKKPAYNTHFKYSYPFVFERGFYISANLCKNSDIISKWCITAVSSSKWR